MYITFLIGYAAIVIAFSYFGFQLILQGHPILGTILALAGLFTSFKIKKD